MTRVSRRSALALAAGALATPLAAHAQGQPSLTIAGVPEDSITPALWAEERGGFKQHGLAVAVQPQSSGSAIAAGVAGGSYQIGKSSLTALILAHSKGVPLKIVAPAGLYDASAPVTGLIVKSDGAIRAVSDLNGKTIAVSSLNDLYTISLKHWMDQRGGNAASIQLVEIPIGAVAAAVEGGRVAAGMLVVPQMQEAVDTGKVRIMARPYDAIAPRFAYAAWFTTADYAKRNASAVARFVAAMRDASAYCNAHHEATVGILAAFTKIPPAVIAKMPRATYGTVNDPKLYQPVVDVAAKYKMIPAPFDAKELLV